MKTQKGIVLICCLLLGIKSIHAQAVLTAAGGEASGLGGSVSYSIGQTCYASIASASGLVSQGVQQPYDVVTDISIHPDIAVSISVYPNPSVAFITLNVGDQELRGLSFQLLDVQGKVLLNEKIAVVETAIRIDYFEAGNYFLKVRDTHSELKTFKITKN
jgi:Secretion system C-terminal sorting domain